jgi:hypothetical protein
MLQAALQLAERGLAVFPCRPRDKRPATAHGCKDATTDVIEVQTWWQENPSYNIGIATGAVSGIFVVDVDNAESELRRLEQQNGELPPTVEAITARGRHLYFRYPSTPVCNTAGKIAEGIDTRSDGGYVLAPPSIHPSGRRYCWSVDSANGFAQAPQWLVDKVAIPDTKQALPTAEWRDLATKNVIEGQRNVTVAKVTGHLLRRYVDPVLALELMQAWNAAHCTPPLSTEEIFRIVNSIAGREFRRRSS